LKGKHHSQETKEKMSKALTGRKMPIEAVNKARIKKYKAVLQFDKNNVLIARYESGIEASKKTGIGRNKISCCCNNKVKWVRGYIWRFEKDEK